MKILLKGIDILFLARPLILVSVWGFSVFGYWCALADKNIFNIGLLWHRTYLPDFFHMLIFSLSVGAVFVLNQIADYEVDLKNDGFPLFVRSSISKVEAYYYTLFLGIISTVIPLFLNKPGIALFSLIAILIGFVYSFKPTYFSGRPVFDFLSNAIGYGIIAFGTGYYLAEPKAMFSLSFWIAAFPFFLLMCGGSICSTFPDYAGDKECGKRTTVVWLGISNANLVASVFFVTGGIIAFITKNWLALGCFFAMTPASLIFIFKNTQKVMESTYKIGGAISMVLAGVIYPLFFPVSIINFILTWIYFRFRHNVSYPSLIPVSDEKKY